MKKGSGYHVKEQLPYLPTLKVLGPFKEWTSLAFWSWRIKFRSALAWTFFVGLLVSIRVIALAKLPLSWFFSPSKILCTYSSGSFIRPFSADSVCSEEEHWKCSLFLLFLTYLVNITSFLPSLRKRSLLLEWKNLHLVTVNSGNSFVLFKEHNLENFKPFRSTAIFKSLLYDVKCWIPPSLKLHVVNIWKLKKKYKKIF